MSEHDINTDRASAQILYDEYALHTPDRQPYWRRPEVQDFTEALKNRKGLFHDRAYEFANELKLLYLLTPQAYVDPAWIINNPFLLYFYLRSFTLHDLPSTDPNNMRCLFGDNDFFVVYWRGEVRTFTDFVDKFYPQTGILKTSPTSSWLTDSLPDPNFKKEILPFLPRFAEKCDSMKTTDIGDPGIPMKKYVSRFLSGPRMYMNQHLDNYQFREPSAVRDLLVETLKVVDTNDRVSMSVAEQACRILSPTVLGSEIGGSSPRRLVILGVNRSSGPTRFLSQLVIVLLSTPMVTATSFWKSLKSSRLFLM